jgi:hypothetical protein
LSSSDERYVANATTIHFVTITKTSTITKTKTKTKTKREGCAPLFCLEDVIATEVHEEGDNTNHDDSEDDVCPHESAVVLDKF